MKLLLPALIVILGIMNASAQPPDKVKNFAELPLAEADELIDHTESGQALIDMVSAAFAARRMELIKLCFENMHTPLITIEQAASISDPTFHDEVVSMMLRSPSGYWPGENPRMSYLQKRESQMVEPFITTLKNRLPDVPLKSEVLETRASRLKLAARLETVIFEAKSKEEPKPDSRKELESSSHKQSPQEGSGSDAPKEKDAISAADAKSVSPITRSLMIISAVAAVVLLGLFLKKRK